MDSFIRNRDRPSTLTSRLAGFSSRRSPALCLARTVPSSSDRYRAYFWMQWQRPFEIFSLLLLAVKPEKLTPQQLQILSLFKTGKQRLLSLIVALGMVWVLWQLYRLAPLAAIAASFLPQWRILGLLIAAFAFAASNLFVQVPVSVLGVLLTGDKKFNVTTPYPMAQISQQFTIPGFKVEKILPPITTQ